MAESNSGGIKIPGFELTLPSSVGGAVALCVTVISICAAIVIVALEAPTKNLREVRGMISRNTFGALEYDGNDLKDLHTRRQFQFMTPSADSWKRANERYGSNSDAQTIRKMFGWTEGVDDARVTRFGDEILAKHFTQGWRRYPFEGQGHFRDTGWWWVITVDEDFDVKKFADFYLNFWRTKEMYLEEFNAYGDVLPNRSIPEPVVPRH